MESIMHRRPEYFRFAGTNVDLKIAESPPLGTTKPAHSFAGRIPAGHLRMERVLRIFLLFALFSMSRRRIGGRLIRRTQERLSFLMASRKLNGGPGLFRYPTPIVTT
jgi:hypothetical protein